MAQHYGLHERIVQRACYRGQMKYVVQDDGFEELYDLSADPFELTNLARATPSSSEMGLMRSALRAEMERTHDPEVGILDKIAS